jgi:hypothetical protein
VQIFHVTTADHLYVFSSKRNVKWNFLWPRGRQDPSKQHVPDRKLAATAGTRSGMIAFRHESMMLMLCCVQSNGLTNHRFIYGVITVDKGPVRAYFWNLKLVSSI